jgi:hypothetical protein
MPKKVSRGQVSEKHEIISKTNTNMLIVIGAATFVVVFCIFAAKALISQSFYHNRIIAEKETALQLLKKNKDAATELKATFDAFQAESQNILGGNPSGAGPIDGSNAELVIDSLPSAYDYPALSSSFEKILKAGGYDIGSIGGSEDATLANNNTPTGKAEPVVIPYSFSVTTSLEGTKNLLTTLENSIRPMYIDGLNVQISSGSLQTRVDLHTFFTQEKTFEVSTKEVK